MTKKKVIILILIDDRDVFIEERKKIMSDIFNYKNYFKYFIFLFLLLRFFDDNFF